METFVNKLLIRIYEEEKMKFYFFNDLKKTFAYVTN